MSKSILAVGKLCRDDSQPSYVVAVADGQRIIGHSLDDLTESTRTPVDITDDHPDLTGLEA